MGPLSFHIQVVFWYDNANLEWKKREPGRPKYAIGSTKQNVIYMAGVYRFENDKHVFYILVCDPTGVRFKGKRLRSLFVTTPS